MAVRSMAPCGVVWPLSRGTVLARARSQAYPCALYLSSALAHGRVKVWAGNLYLSLLSDIPWRQATI
jgi:hypothetical protein